MWYEELNVSWFVDMLIRAKFRMCEIILQLLALKHLQMQLMKLRLIITTVKHI